MSRHIALVYPSGKFHYNNVDKEERIQALKSYGFKVTDLSSSFASPENITAAPVLDRLTFLCHALTNRKFDIVMAGRGGYGVTEIISFLNLILPPVLPAKTFVGFSDNSYLGVYLSLIFKNFRYIHAKHAFSQNLLSDVNHEKSMLFDLLNHKESQYTFKCHAVFSSTKSIEGPCIPLNLSLAESLAATKNVSLPKYTILFLEDTHEYVYRMFRKFDSLINSGFLENVSAVVLGEFTKPFMNNGEEIQRSDLLKLIAQKLKKPVIDFPVFGHGDRCFPLVAHSLVRIEPIDDESVNLYLTSVMEERSSNLNESRENCNFHNVHLCGVGGTGMASVAGILKQAGYSVSGSDREIYPPMDTVLEQLNIVPDIGYKAENIQNKEIDSVIIGNVMSRTTSSLQKNPELDAILQTRLPIMSFPSALRTLFLSQSFNIVVAGTHGKTTTSSLAAFLLDSLNENPSFLIGGMPGNFTSGFRLGSPDLFVLEGDEYDSAFFDKGPKFLHYEPNVTIINNIEFDHADIYDNIEQIEEEFLRLAELTQEKKGLNVVNWSDFRVRRIAESLQTQCIAFDSNLSQESSISCPYPKWTLESFETHLTGITVHVIAPNSTKYKIFISQLFGEHNALNFVAVLAALFAKSIIQGGTLELFLDSLKYVEAASQNFKGIKRRFELLCHYNDVLVFEDFAHHPTAIRTTLEAFRDYISLTKRKGRLIVCFDPHNATLRRKIFEKDLAKSFSVADLLLFGKIPKDLRVNQSDILDESHIIDMCDINAYYFSENDKLLDYLQNTVKKYDTIVFMSSGSFDGIIQKFVQFIQERVYGEES